MEAVSLEKIGIFSHPPQKPQHHDTATTIPSSAVATAMTRRENRRKPPQLTMNVKPTGKSRMKCLGVVISGLASLLLLIGVVRADENEKTLDPTIAKEIPVDGFPKVILKHSIMLQRNGEAVRAASPNETFIAVWGDQKKGIVYLLDEDDPDNNEPYAIPLDESVTKAGADHLFSDILTAAETSQYGNVISVADNGLKVDPNNILFFNFRNKAGAICQSQRDIVALRQAIEQGNAQADQAHKNATVIGGKHPYNWDHSCPRRRFELM